VTDVASAPALKLDRSRPLAVDAPVLDESQRRVIAHRAGAMLVLAGPGTGKTTTLVEAMVARLRNQAPLRPDQVLGLTFGRKAAAEWKQRVTARLGGGLVPTITTFHSFAYALVRAESDPLAFAEPLRLLSGAEQEARLRELLDGSVRDGHVQWPQDLSAALGTRGLAAEVRCVIAKARSLGLDPQDLEALSAHADVLGPAWQAIGRFFGEYLDVLDAEGVTDYTEIIHRASILAHDPQIQHGLRQRYRAIFVDEYQDTDPAQVHLLRGLVDPSASLIVVGDPDQSIYAFRGADSTGIANFRDRFTQGDGSQAEVVVLQHTRRFGPIIGQAAAKILRSAAITGIPSEVVRAHRNLIYQAPTDGVVDVRTFDSESSEAAHIANILRRAHLEHGVGWDEMAVLVRSGRRSIGPLRRALGSAGVPVEVAADEIPLREEPALAPLLLALKVVLDPHQADEAEISALLLSPLADADPSDLRRLGRALRRIQREEHPDERPTPSSALVRQLAVELIDDPDAPLPIASGSNSRDVRARGALDAVRRLAAVIRAGRNSIGAQGNTEDVLWAVWSAAAAEQGTGWPRRLEAAALRGGDAGRRADADLDAIVALFAAAQRAEERFGGRRGITNFIADLTEQEIPADTLADRGIRGPAVRVMTAHRSKGLQWRIVCVAGVQEGIWPDLRRRGTLLAADRLERSGMADAPSPAALLAEERRLFYVACTRASEELHVAAVASRADDGLQPSRFVEDLLGRELTDAEHVSGRPARPLSVSGLVASLRMASVDPVLEPNLRHAAARRLAVLASAVTADGRPVVTHAHPDQWWGMKLATVSPTPIRPPTAPLDFSGSQLSSIGDCPLRWFLQHEVHADVSRSTALGFGSIIHELADAVAREDVPAEEAVLTGYIDRVWGELGYEAAWYSAAERSSAVDALGRFVAWHKGRPERQLIGSEVGFDLTIPIGAHGVHLRGSFDRVEVTVDGSVHIVDLKTQRNPESKEKIETHQQLGLYQLAVEHGALDEIPEAVRASAVLPPVGTPPPVGGAELVLLRLGKDLPKVQGQQPLDPDNRWVEQALESADALVRSEQFPAVTSSRCDSCSFRVTCPAQDEGREVIP